jgi:predicted nucleic acid-binding protein
VAFLVSDHRDHDRVFEAMAGRELGLAGHAAFETFSVLTRLPAPARRSPAVVSRLLAQNFPATRFVSAGRTASLVAELAGHGIAGGSVYDALVAASAVEHGLTLASRDHRAQHVYRVVGAEVQMLD